MAVEFQQATVNFDLTAGIRQKEPGSVSFSRPILTEQSVQCAVRGFNIKYGSGDHPLHELEIDIDGPKRRDNDHRTVDFKVDLVLRDASGTYDDAYKGWVQVLVIADTQ